METARLTPVRLRPSAKEAGFSMVELLLAAFIMAIGLFGLLGLQLASIKQNTQSRSRGTATMLAHNLLDRITAIGTLAVADRSNNNTPAPYDPAAPPANPMQAVLANLSADTKTTDGDSSTTESKGCYGFLGETVPTDRTSYYDITGAKLPKDDPARRVFTVTWSRTNERYAGPWNATAEYTVNVQWEEAPVPGKTVTQKKYFSVSRNVRI